MNVKMIGRVGLLSLALLSSVTFARLTIQAYAPRSFHARQSSFNWTQRSTSQGPIGVALDTRGNIFVAEPTCIVNFQTCPTGLIDSFSISGASNAILKQGKHFVPPPGTTYFAYYLAVDKQENIWFTDATNNAIGEVSASDNTWTEWHVREGSPSHLVVDSVGNVWFTSDGLPDIGFFDTTAHTFVETPIPSGSSAQGITLDANEDIWFAESQAPEIGNFTPTTSGIITITEHLISSQTKDFPIPYAIAASKSGGIWYSEVGGGAGQVGEYLPGTDSHRDFPVGSSIAGISADSNGLVWFDDLGGSNALVGYLDPATGKTSTIPIPHVDPEFPVGLNDGLVVDVNNNVWFSQTWNERLGEIFAPNVPPPTPSPTDAPSPMPSPTSIPTSIPSPTPSPTPSPAKAPISPIWYFAEGKVGAGFTEYITIENPDTVNDCPVTLHYLLGSGSPASKSVVVPRASRWTEYVNGDLTTSPTSNSYKVVSTVVSVNTGTTCQGVVAERPMYFTNFAGISSGSDALGATHASTSFSFADVPTLSGYHTFITVLNPPGGNPAHLNATFFAGGVRVDSQTLTVQPGTRGTLIPMRLFKHEAAILTSDQPIVAERPTYFSHQRAGNAGTVSGAASVIGVPQPATDWLFAEGYTGSGFQENLVLANFGTTDTSGSLILEYDNGTLLKFAINVPHQDQVTYNVNLLTASPGQGTCNTNPCATSRNVSIEVLSTSGIVAEREMFFHYSHTVNSRSLLTTGGTDITGQEGPAAAMAYSFAEGYTNKGYDEWLTLQNPTPNSERMSITLVNGNGQMYSQAFSIESTTRATVDITALVIAHLAPPGAPVSAYEVSMVVRSSDGPFVAERPLYWNTGGTGSPTPTQGGSDVRGYTGN